MVHDQVLQVAQVVQMVEWGKAYAQWMLFRMADI